MRSTQHILKRSLSSPVLLAACSIFILGTAAHADIVKLSGGRSVRVVGVSSDNGHATLTLTSGGVMTVPNAAVESIEAESVDANLCAASAFRCQDRAMLMLRRTQVQATAATVAREHAPSAAKP
jgi:hypothetical protein